MPRTSELKKMHNISAFTELTYASPITREHQYFLVHSGNAKQQCCY